MLYIYQPCSITSSGPQFVSDAHLSNMLSDQIPTNVHRKWVTAPFQQCLQISSLLDRKWVTTPVVSLIKPQPWSTESEQCCIYFVCNSIPSHLMSKSKWIMLYIHLPSSLTTYPPTTNRKWVMLPLCVSARTLIASHLLTNSMCVIFV